MRAAALLLDRLSGSLNRIALWGAILSVLMMLGSAGWQVIARYVLSQPPVWTEELARFSMVWAGLLGASCAFRWHSDPSLFVAAQKMTGRTGTILSLLRASGVIAFVTPIVWFSLFGANMNPARGYIARLAGRQAETMDLPMTVFGVAIPIAFTLILIHLIADVAMRLTANSDPQSSEG